MGNGALFPGVRRAGRESEHSHLVLKFRMSGAGAQPPYALMACTAETLLY
jgi:hypothetical protein